jgi:hypothetical protein
MDRRRTSNQEWSNDSSFEIINGIRYEVRMINGRESRIERGAVSPVENSAPPAPTHAPIQLVDVYGAKSSEVEMRQRAARGARIMLDRIAQQAKDAEEDARRAEEELDILAFQAVAEQDKGHDQQQLRERLSDGSGDAWTPADSTKLNNLLRQNATDDYVSPAALIMQPEMENPFATIIERVGQPSKQKRLRSKGKNEPAIDGGRNGEQKKKLSRKQKVVRLGAVGVLVAAGIPLATMYGDANKQADVQSEKQIATLSPEEKAIIDKKANPDITPASIAIGQCLSDGAELFNGHASGISSEAWVFKAADGTLKGAQTPDNKYPPIEVKSAPFNVAACAPADVRTKIVTMKDAAITIDRSEVYPEVRMVVGGTVTPTTQEFAATPEVGLTDAGAKALNLAQADEANRNSAATIAYANLAQAIVRKDSVDLGRVEAQMDIELLQSVNDQIDAFYKKQGKEAPTFNLTLSGDFHAPKVIDPTTLPDILTKTKDIVRLTPSTLTALDFSTDSSATSAPTPSGK